MPLLPWDVCGPQTSSMPRVLDGNEVFPRMSPGTGSCSTLGVLDCQPTAALPGASFPKDCLAIILTCHDQSCASVPCPLFLRVWATAASFLKTPPGSWQEKEGHLFPDRQKLSPGPGGGFELHIWAGVLNWPRGVSMVHTGRLKASAQHLR